MMLDILNMLREKWVTIMSPYWVNEARYGRLTCPLLVASLRPCSVKNAGVNQRVMMVLCPLQLGETKQNFAKI